MTDKLDEKDIKALKELDEYFNEIFDEFRTVRKSLDHASNLLKRLRSLIALKPIYDLIMRNKEGDLYFRTERMLANLEEGSMRLRLYIAEIEKQNSKKATKHPILENKIDPNYH
jgi:hypothetical protein